jgi:hypothetical protein
MPVEIRELVIQARLKEGAAPRQRKALTDDADLPEETLDTAAADSSGNKQDTEADDCKDQMADDIYERCLARLKEWLADKSMR